MKTSIRRWPILVALASFLALFGSPLRAQELTSTVPDNGTFGVATDTSVQFTFDTAMETSDPTIQWTSQSLLGGSPTPLNGISYSWNGSGRTVTATRSGGFPGSSIITWQIPGGGVFTEDGFPNTSTFAGAFITAAGGGGGGGGDPTNTTTVTVLRQAIFYQVSSADPVAAAAQSHFFTATVESTAERGLTNVIVTPPAKPAITLFSSFFEPQNFFFGEPLDSQAELDTAYPAGTYSVTLQAPGSNQVVSVAVPSIAFPAAPKVLNLDEAQSVDPSQDFALAFDAGGDPDEFVRVSVSDPETDDEVIASGDFDDATALAGSDIGFVVPAGTLTSGKAYTVTLERWHGDTGTDGGTDTVAGIGTGTITRLATTGGATPAGTAQANLVRTEFFDQTGTGTPTAATTNGFSFRAETQAPASRLLDGGLLAFPDLRVIELLDENQSGETSFAVEQTFNTSAAELARFPAGGYVFNLLALGSNQVVALTLPTAVHPAAPKLVNYTAAQAIDPTAQFTLQLDLGGQAADFAMVQIRDAATDNTVFESPDYGSVDALTGASTSLILSASLLQSDKAYKIEIQRYVVQKGGANGVDTAIGFGAVTRTALHTINTSVPPVITLSNPVHTGNAFNVTASVNVLNAAYQLVRSTDYVNWSIVDTKFVTSAQTTFTDSNPNNSFFIYQVRKP